MQQLVKVLLLLAVWLGAVAHAGPGFRYGPWDVDEMPDGAEQSRQDGVTAFKVGNVMYMFTPASPLEGKTLAQIAKGFIADFVAGKGEVVSEATTDTNKNTGLTLYMQPVVIAESKDMLRLYYLNFFARNDQWALALVAAPIREFNANAEEILAPMSGVEFNPQEIKALEMFPAPKLKAVPFPVPRTDRVALSQPNVDFPAARKMGLDPERDLIPDVFDCYILKQNRALVATPDGRLTVSKNGQYSFTDGAATRTGRWGMKVSNDNFKYVWFEGDLVEDQEFVDDNDFGQGFSVSWKGKGLLYCAQQGPFADEYRLNFAKVLPGSETYQCVMPGDPQPFTLQMNAAAGTYQTSRGGGHLRVALQLDEYRSYNKPDAELYFNGGPLDLSDGKIEEDEFGNRSMKTVFETSKGSIFYKQTTTNLTARCSTKLPKPRPFALYGLNSAPATGVKAPFDGVFLSLQDAMLPVANAIIGTTYMKGTRYELFYFSPDGYYLQDIEPSEQGALPDCKRTKPNGDPLCDQYQVNGNRILWEDSDDEWVPFVVAKDRNSFQIANEDFHRIQPFKDNKLNGVYSNSSLSFNGTPGAFIGGGASTTGNFSNGYVFTPEGQFLWRSSSSSTTFVNPGMFGAGVSVTASSSSSDGGEGTYTLQGNWLNLNFRDGRYRKLYVYTMPAAYAGEKAELNIDGQSLLKQNTK